MLSAELTLYAVEINLGHGRLKPRIIGCVLVLRLLWLLRVRCDCLRRGRLQKWLKEGVIGGCGPLNRWRGDLRGPLQLEQLPPCVKPIVIAGRIRQVVLKATDVRRQLVHGCCGNWSRVMCEVGESDGCRRDVFVARIVEVDLATRGRGTGKRRGEVWRLVERILIPKSLGCWPGDVVCDARLEWRRRQSTGAHQGAADSRQFEAGIGGSLQRQILATRRPVGLALAPVAQALDEVVADAHRGVEDRVKL